MEGNYVHLVADMSAQPMWEVTVCALGVMGTVYKRDTPIPGSITVE